MNSERRHLLTKEELSRIAGKTGCRDAYYEIKRKVLAAIAEAQPWLEFECWRQEDRLDEQEASAWALYWENK